MPTTALTTVTVQIRADLAVAMTSIGRQWDHRSKGIGHDLESGINSESLVTGIKPVNGITEMTLQGAAADIAETLNDLWKHLLHTDEDELCALVIGDRVVDHWWVALEEAGIENPEVTEPADQMKLLLAA
jgi:hypothetical protein